MTLGRFQSVPKQIASEYPVVEGTRCVSVRIPDDDLFLPVLAAMHAALGNTWSSVGSVEQRRAWALMWQTAYAETDWEGCMDCCGEILEALEAQAALLDEIKQTQVDNGANERELQQSAVINSMCGAAGAVADAMYAQIMATYSATENGFVDNAFELIPLIISAIPVLAALPFDDLFNLVDGYFENQVSDFSDDYEIMRQDFIDSLSCFVQVNMNVFDWDVWVDWLESLPMSYPTSRAARIFNLQSPLKQTWFNQILATVNKNASLQTYFDSLSAAWDAGLETPSTACADCPDAPNIYLVETFPGLIINNPTFVANTATGSIWEATYFDTGTEGWAVALTPQIEGANVCCTLTFADPVDHYQHEECGGSLVTGSGPGMSPPDWQLLGFFGPGAGTLTIEVEPA